MIRTTEGLRYTLMPGSPWNGAAGRGGFQAIDLRSDAPTNAGIGYRMLRMIHYEIIIGVTRDRKSTDAGRVTGADSESLFEELEGDGERE